MADLKKLQGLKKPEPKCLCGKNIYYSEDAARFALRQVQARRIIQYGQPAEREVYECPEVLGSDVWHLTSNNGREKSEELRQLRAEREETKQ